MKKSLLLVAVSLALSFAACGPNEALISSGAANFAGSKDPSKGLDEALTAESDLATSEAALTLSPLHAPVCNGAGGWARCYSRIRLAGNGTVQPASTPQGLGPADIQSAYNVSGGSSGLTVAIVDAYDDPNAESDLAVYRSQYGLPPCTTANGCFKKVNENGQTSPLPQADTGWAGEIALDLDMVSAACPSCKILLVEANQPSTDDLGTAVNAAAALGAVAISNSYGGSEDSTVTSADSSYYNHPGVLITASSGDNGYGASYPATGAHVLAVGGTALSKSTNSRGWSETAWSGAGSGCSRYISKPSFQSDTGCSKRMEADVSAVADPNTGVSVYDTYGGSGWNVYGGTSASSPIVAAIFARTGHAGDNNGFPYAHTSDFYDVTSGSNGSCSASYQCKAGAGYDGPTGWGTPNGAALMGTSGTGGGSGGGSGTGGGSGGGSGGGTGGGSGGGTGGGAGGGTGGGSGGGTGGGSGGGTGGGAGGGTGGGSGGGTGGGAGGGGGSSGHESEPNNSRSTANLLVNGVTMVGSISPASDVDYFKISVSPGNTIDVRLSNLNADCDLRIYSSSGSLLAISDNGGTTAEEIYGTVSNSIYYARVNGYNGAKCTNYHLDLTVQ